MKFFTNCGMPVDVIHTHIHTLTHTHTHHTHIKGRIYDGFILFCYYLNCL